jgi:hypothetical protein
MEKKTVRTIWGVYGILAIAGTVGSYLWYKRFFKNLSKSSTPEYDDEETA